MRIVDQICLKKAQEYELFRALFRVKMIGEGQDRRREVSEVPS